jgi:hypothetical protein
MKKALLFLSVIFSLGFSEESFAQRCNQANSLVSVTKRKSGRTEYVIFTLKMPVTASTAVSNVSPPFTQDPSGNPVTIAGCKYKKVRFTNIIWQCTIAENFSSSTYLIRQVKKTGQFEGIIEYVIGYRCNATSVVSYDYIEGAYKKFVVRLKY